MTIIPIILFFLLAPAILFGVPRFRRSQESWVLAFKTVPLGCLMSLVLFGVSPGLFSALERTETEFVLLIPIIAVGILFIYGFAKMLKRLQGDKTQLPIKHLARVYCLYAGVLALFGVLVVWYLWSSVYTG